MNHGKGQNINTNKLIGFGTFNVSFILHFINSFDVFVHLFDAKF